MKALILAIPLILAACSTQDRYNTLATTCQTYSAALRTAAALNNAGKLSIDQQNKITATIPAAEKACTGSAPTNDALAVQKLSEAIIAVLDAQGNN